MGVMSVVSLATVASDCQVGSDTDVLSGFDVCHVKDSLDVCEFKDGHNLVWIRIQNSFSDPWKYRTGMFAMERKNVFIWCSYIIQ
jgi:hypothetical protein